LPESPNSLVERGHDAKGKAVLEKLRGTTEIDAEYEDIKEAVEFSSKVTFGQSWKNQLTRPYLPMFIVTITLAIAQQLSGINSIMFYVPVIFNSLGSGRRASLLNTVIIGAVNVLATFVDKAGRRALYLAGGVQMSVSLIVVGAVLGVEFGKYTAADLPSSVAIAVLVMVCIFVSAFAYSSGKISSIILFET
jgi:MFS transporter, SP family, sugar:H+ symporter